MSQEVDATEIASIFASFRTELAHLSMTLEHARDLVELTLDIPQQPSPAFEMHLNLQNDELHCMPGPSGWSGPPAIGANRRDIVVSYCEAVRGLRSGTYRIVEHCRGKHVVNAELQAPAGSNWKTVGTWSTWPTRFWRPRSIRILHNGS